MRRVVQPMANFLAQHHAAAKQMEEMHKKLMSAGAEWDGMDGYSLTVAQAKEFFK